MSDKCKYLVPALERSNSILEYVASSYAPPSMADIAKGLDLPKSSTFALLNTLVALGFLRKDRDSAYSLGLRLYSLGNSAIKQLFDNVDFLTPMNRLRDESGNTVHLCAYDNGEITVLEKLDGIGVVQFKAFRGMRKRLNTSAGGKAVAAYLSQDELEKVISRGFDSFTATSLDTKEAFLAHLPLIRQTGYSLDAEEGELGVRCLGAPFFAADGSVLGAISMTSLTTCLPIGKIDHYAAMVHRAGRALSQELGFSGEYPSLAHSTDGVHPYQAYILNCERLSSIRAV